ncbi:MAG: filamentous hemagglutinin N-terminal domain-containing protein [Nitrospinae bacterium]|nr:filamentous hemagglutinin N-terminal domain-containing protein [Nitrospinota bacterium]
MKQKMENKVGKSLFSRLHRVESRNNVYKHFVCILAAWFALFPTFVFALPADPTVKAGSVTFDQVDPNTLHVLQSTNKAIIDWHTFSIQANEATHFQMPSSNSFNLSRVTGGVGSEIFGTLTSNGNLMLLNPNGILFGANSKIDVGGLVATTANISDSDFMAGNYRFDIPSSINRTVINRGTINVAQGGLLAFVAPGVENSGIINAQLGQVSLASGKTFTLDLYGDKLVSLGVGSKVLDQVIGPDGQPVSSLIKNGGSIHANGGTVFLEVSAARDVVDNVINMDGLIEAKTAVQENGEIILYGGEEGLVNVTGTLDASGKEAGQTGGEVQVLGEWVALLENTFIDVSGDLGGGTALIGGDYQGKGLVPTSEKTYFHSTAFVTADALSSGNGGKVILWADDATYFYGGISAIGGLQSGNGGFVETSGKKYLDFDGSVDVAALNGEAGTVLLDPASITLLSGVDSNSTGFTAGSDVSELFAEDSAAATVLNPDASGSFDGISAGSTIILQATDFITVSNNFVLATATGNSNVNLVMQTGGSINVNANLTLDGTGTLHLEADSVHSSSGAADGTGAINIAASQTITAGGAVTLIAADYGLVGSISAGSNNVTIGQSVAGTLALGTATSSILTDTELDNITTTGTLTIGQATTKGSDGAGTSASTITSGAITLDELTLGSKNITLVSSSTINDDDDTGTAIETTGTLTLTSGAAIGSSGGSQGLDIDVGTLAITGTGSGNVTITEADDLVLGAVTVGGTFSATATTGNITDSGTLTITGASTFITAADGSNIVLDSASNAFSNSVEMRADGGGETFGNITFVDSAAIDFATSAGSDGDLFINAGTDGAVGGNLSVTATTGNITDTVALAVTGTSSFTTSASNATITLGTTTNSFSGAVTLNTTGASANATIDGGTSTLDLAASTIGGNLAVTAGDSITDSGVLTVGGTASFTTDTTDKPITLNSQNAVTGQLTFSTIGTGGDVTFDNGTTAISLGTISSGDIGGDLILLTDTATTISNAVTMNGSGAALSITVDGGNALNVQAALTTNAGAITLSADDDVIFTAAGDLTSNNGNISVTADDDATSDAGSGGALTMVDGTVFNAGSGTISGVADEDITLGQMTTTNATSSAITLNTASGNILDGDTTEANDLTASSGTVDVTTGGGTFGTDANPIEITSATLTTTGVPVTVVTPKSDETLSGTTETVGEASVDQTINIVENLAMTVAQGNQAIAGNNTSTVSAGVAPLQPGPGPIIVDVFSQPYELIKMEEVDPQLAPAMNQWNDIWVGEENEN